MLLTSKLFKLHEDLLAYRFELMDKKAYAIANSKYRNMTAGLGRTVKVQATG